MKNKSQSFSQIMKSFSGKWGIHQLFNDFLELTVCALQRGQAEERYLEIAVQYDKDEMLKFSHALGALILEMGEMPDPKDPLGDFFTLEVTNGHNGQFFTPDGICKLMAQITVPKQSDDKSYYDPTCGSGRTLLAAASVAGPNNWYFGSDLDRRCAMMTAINMCLHGLKGEIVCMNALSMEFFAGWHIMTFPSPYLSAISEAECIQKPKPVEEQVVTSKMPDPIPFSEESTIQLSLF